MDVKIVFINFDYASSVIKENIQRFKNRGFTYIVFPTNTVRSSKRISVSFS